MTASGRSINHDNFRSIIRNSGLLAGGGGGDHNTAAEIFQQEVNGEIPVRNIDDFEPDENLATFFGLGPVRDDNSSDIETVRRCVNEFEEQYGEISGIVLGEIGPEVIVSGCLAAQELDVPLVNADVAGMRAVPRVENEIIESMEINRLPAVACSQEGDTVTIENQGLEAALRGLDDTTWFITGYLNSAEDFRQLPQGWFENCLTLPKSNIEILGTGEIINWQSAEVEGFTIGRIDVQTDSSVLQIYFLNENAFVIEENQVIAEMPDSITLQTTNGEPIYNGNPPNLGETVEIIIFDQEDYWQENRDTLNPASIGFRIDQSQIYYEDTPVSEILGEHET